MERVKLLLAIADTVLRMAYDSCPESSYGMVVADDIYDVRMELVHGCIELIEE